ncbi:MAG: ATP synthase F0 subunit C [Bdellovibrionales bacterium]|nr:ATP synthase F0 subunit C [Bdellovibrionales bacterium]
MKKNISLIVAALVASAFVVEPAFAADGVADIGLGKLAAGICMGIAALGGALGQGRAVSSALDSVGRNPSAAGKVFNPMIIGLALIESLVILSFVIAFSLL